MGAADTLSLLFELDVDGRPGAAGLLRYRKDVASTVEFTRRLLAQPLKSFNTAPVVTAAKASSAVQEKEQRRLNSAVQSLQRQRSAALIRAFKDEERAAVASARAQERAAQQASRSISQAFRGIGPGLQSIGRTLTLGITAPLLALGAVAVKSAKDLDANVNTLKAFTGSAEAAERRLAQLIKTARGTPGLTTNLALTLDAQLRVAQTTQETIDRVLPAIGRLNAVAKLPDVGRFTQNLLQLVTQNFEKQDLKELVGQSPLAGQLLTEIFKVDSPTNAKAIREQAKKLGLTTVDAFFNAFAEAAARNQGLATVTESIGTRFDKIVDRVTVALRPLGLSILRAIEPFVEPVAKLIERVGAAFDSLSDPVKTAVIVIAGITAAAGPVLFVLGSLATAITGIVSAVTAVVAVIGTIGFPPIAAAVAGIVIILGEWAVILGALGLAWKDNFLNIRGVVTDAAEAVLQAFGRIKMVVTEIVERILPTLQSITTKVLALVSAAWEKYGKDVIAVISVAFNFAMRVVEGFVRAFGDVVDLLLKLIDGDFRGAWNAFSRIIVNALNDWRDFMQALGLEAVKAFSRLIAFIASQAVAIAKAGHDLASRFIAALATEIIKGFPTIRDALTEMFVQSALGFQPATAVAIMVAKLVDAIKKGAKVRVPITIEPVLQENLERIELNPDGTVKSKKTTRPSSDEENTKGADAATRRRIRLLELEADRTEAINRQNIDAERLRFELREKSLRQATDDEITLEREILEKKKAVFAAELIEAQKLKKGRELAIKEISLKSLQAEIEFHNKENALRVRQQQEEERAAIEHRQKLLDIQDQGDQRQLARLEEQSRTGGITAFDLERRRAELEDDARRRRRVELETQLNETKENKEERERIKDQLAQFDEESAAATEEGERRKRDALQETADAYRNYALGIREALESASEAVRSAAAISLGRLNARVLLSERERIERQFALDRKALDAEKRATDLRIDNAEREAVEKAKRVGDFEERALEIERTFNALRLAEQKRFDQERRRLDEDKKAALERANPTSGRSLFGDVFADVTEATGSALQGLLATGQDVFAQLSAQAGNMRDIMVNVFSAIGQAVGDAAQAFVLYGNSGTSVKKVTAQVIAGVASMSAVKAIFELAEGFAALARGIFGNPKGFAEAALHFKSAAIYGAVAGVAALAGRAVAGNSFSDKGTASAGVNGGQAEPRNREFRNGGLPVESSSSAVREGSGGSILGRLAARIDTFQQQNLELQKQQQLHNATVAQALTKLGTARPGDVVTMGAGDARQAIAVAVIDHSDSDGNFNERLQRNLGFA